MISDQEFLHGAAFLRMIDSGHKVTITHASHIHNSIYLIETDKNKSAVLFKVSTKPQSSWSFNLTKQEELAINKIHEEHPHFSVFIALICQKDGICCLSEEQFWSIMDKNSEINSRYISVSRQSHGSYHVSGPSRQKMDRTIPQKNWPDVLIK
jgi:hypothetical protein